MPTDYETGWLIEIPGPYPSWWTGQSASSFTTDPGNVFRMARREDAERALGWKLCVPPPGEVRITEHQWLGGIRPDPAPADIRGGAGKPGSM